MSAITGLPVFNVSFMDIDDEWRLDILRPYAVWGNTLFGPHVGDTVVLRDEESGWTLAKVVSQRRRWLRLEVDWDRWEPITEITWGADLG